MKKTILILLLTIQLANATTKDSLSSVNSFKKYYLPLDKKYFCDACGCSASGGSMGFASMLNSNFIGIRYFNQNYKTTDGLYSNSAWYKENFNTTQVWARIPIVKNLQVSVIIPYHFHHRNTPIGVQSINGLGDITLLGMYRLYQTHNDSTKLVHSLHLGAGIKIATGKFNESSATGVNPSFQLGTGSWDYILATEYIVKKKQFGLSTLMNYTIKTENRNQYRFGNQFNYAGTFFYLYEKNKYSFAPQFGFAGEVYSNNYQHQQELRDTSGDIIFGKIGFEIGKNKLSFGANFMRPISQNLTAGRVEANFRWSMNLNYSL